MLDCMCPNLRSLDVIVYKIESPNIYEIWKYHGQNNNMHFPVKEYKLGLDRPFNAVLLLKYTISLKWGKEEGVN